MQHWDAACYVRHAGFVADLGVPVLDWLAPQPHERILDLGCGDGALTAVLAQRAGAVVGVDASASQVAAACARGLDARVMDAHALSFRGEFDAVFSNAALHWMQNMPAVLRGVARALRPGGRFAGEFGGAGNIAAVRGALDAALARRGVSVPDPWYFPAPADFAAALESAGFRLRDLAHFPRPTPVPTGLRNWLLTFAQSQLAPLDSAERGAVLDEAEAALRPVLCDAAGQWSVDYVRLRFVADLQGLTERN